MVIERAVAGVVDGLKRNPMVLALVVINVLYLGAAGWLLSELAERAQQRDSLLVKLASRDCPPATR